MSGRRSGVIVVALAVILAACGIAIANDAKYTVVTQAPNSSGGSTNPALTPAAPLVWTGCGSGLDCATLRVPLVYGKASGKTIDLYVQRHKALNRSKRIGTLLVNPGGPGIGGTELTESAAQIYSQDVLARFDIVAWDPRGTGKSNAVDCFDNVDQYYAQIDPTPDNAVEKEAILQVGRNWAKACAAKVDPELLANISTQDTARDMDEIRKVLGETQVSWFGFSYGSELGATYATMFPDRVRAMVLDGSIDPNQSAASYLEVSSKLQDETLGKILSQCSKKSSCAFHNGGNAEGAFDALMAALDKNPVSAKGADPGRPRVGQAIATMALIQALYVPQFWDVLTDALAQAQHGDGQGLLDLYDQYMRRNPDGSFSNAIEDLYAISCLDDPGPTTVTELDALGSRLRTVAPRTGDSFLYLDPCLTWPVKPVTPLKITGKGAGTVLVVGSTGDPITPLSLTRNMAKALEGGTLLIRVGEGHTSYGSGNSCIDKAVDKYLVELIAPPDGTTCS